MYTYKVGGAVRDKLLGNIATDNDYVVVGSSIEEMLSYDYKQIGREFPVFMHPITKEHYALARTERKIAPGHHGFISYTDYVSLYEDLARRDLTINAIAQDVVGTIIDPFNGEADLHAGILRNVTAAFADDPLRILRIARFAAKFNAQIAPETQQLLLEMGNNKDGRFISKERIVSELEKALIEPYLPRFFEVLIQTNNLGVFFSALKHLQHVDDFFTSLKVCCDRMQIYTVLSLYSLQENTKEFNFSMKKQIIRYMHITCCIHQCTYNLQTSTNYSSLEGSILQLIISIDALRKPQIALLALYNYLLVCQDRLSDDVMNILSKLPIIIAIFRNHISTFITDHHNYHLPTQIRYWKLTIIKHILSQR